uniref:Syntaxin 17 n=1 Tax=Eptatretus burgeri TaxID=7764 RepID=A0A8C4QUH7_EPTBU
MQDNTNVLSLHRLEPVVNKFIKVAIPTDLERLDKHRMNMEKQLQHNLRELESLRIRLRAIDQPTFDDRVRLTQDRAATVVQDFLALHKAMQQAPGCPNLETSEETMLKSDKANVVLDDATDAAPCGAGAYITECAYQEAQQVQLQVQQQQIEESWEHLAKDLHELDNLVTEFSQLVYVQQETMDSITENVERASDNVAEGTQQLGKAVQGAAAVLPVAGAVLGGAVAGPLGLLAGLKLGVPGVFSPDVQQEHRGDKQEAHDEHRHRTPESKRVTW